MDPIHFDPIAQTGSYGPFQVSQHSVQDIAQENRMMYMKVTAASAVVTACVGLLIYFVKPNIYLKDKKDKKSDLDIGMFVMTCIGVFVGSFCILYLLHNSMWPASKESIAEN